MRNDQSSHIIVGLILLLAALAVYFFTIRPDLLIAGFGTRPVEAETVFVEKQTGEFSSSDYHIQPAENERQFQWTIDSSEL